MYMTHKLINHVAPLNVLYALDDDMANAFSGARDPAIRLACDARGAVERVERDLENKTSCIHRAVYALFNICDSTRAICIPYCQMHYAFGVECTNCRVFQMSYNINTWTMSYEGNVKI